MLVVNVFLWDRQDGPSNLVVAAHPNYNFWLQYSPGGTNYGGKKTCWENSTVFGELFFFFFTLVIFLSIQVVHKWCVSPGPCLLIPRDSSPFLPCHNSESGDQNNMSNLGHPPLQKYIYRCRVFHRASAYSNTSASAPQTPGLCLSLNIYFQRINARGRQVLSPRQKGDIRNSNTGVQTHIFAPLTGFRRQRYLCFSFFFVAPPALASRWELICSLAHKRWLCAVQTAYLRLCVRRTVYPSFTAQPRVMLFYNNNSNNDLIKINK